MTNNLTGQNLVNVHSFPYYKLQTTLMLLIVSDYMLFLSVCALSTGLRVTISVISLLTRLR